MMSGSTVRPVLGELMSKFGAGYSAVSKSLLNGPANEVLQDSRRVKVQLTQCTEILREQLVIDHVHSICTLCHTCTTNLH